MSYLKQNTIVETKVKKSTKPVLDARDFLRMLKVSFHSNVFAAIVSISPVRAAMGIFAIIANKQ
jgi:hypothetical protein